jgi:hypothetical protein
MENNNMNEGEEINEFQEGGDDYLNFVKEGERENFNFNQGDEGGEREGGGEEMKDENET